MAREERTMVTERQIQLINYILKHPEGITGQKLSEEFKVSGKTIRNDVAQINSWLLRNECRVSASKRTGYYISEEHSTRVKECMDHLEPNRSEKSAESPAERKYYILGKVLGRIRIGMDELSERLYVSEQTIYKDVTALQLFLKKNYGFHGVRIESNEIILDESEFTIREMVFRMIQTQVSSTNKQMDLNFYQFVKDIVNLDEIHEFVRFISHYCDKKEILISDQLLYISGWILFYTNVRIGEGFTLEIEDTFPKNDRLASFLLEINEKWFLDFKDSDLCQLYDFLEALGFLSPDSGSISSDTEFVCSELMARVKEMYGIDFGTMPALAENMKRHLEFSIRRIRLDYQLKNPLKDEVKKNYSFSYQIALLLVQLLYEVYEKYPTEDEVSFFAVYIQTCLQMQSATVRVQIVHGTTLGHIHLIENWLRREFADRIHVCGYCSAYSLADVCREKQIQLVIATVEPMTDLQVPTVVISRLPTEQDKKNIDQVITQIISKGYGDSLLESLLNAERITFFENGENLEEMIGVCAKLLQKTGCIADAQEFCRATLQREEVYPTLMEHGCYLPHPLINQASQNGISMGIVRKTGMKDSKASILFVLALEPKIDKRFQKIYNFIQSIAGSPLTIQDLQAMETQAGADKYLQNMFTII